MNIKAKAVSGIKWTTLATIIVTILQLLQLAILARFLDPSEFGLMALVMVVIGFSKAFLDMGISNAIIHKQEINKNQLSTLYWVNVLAGFVLFVVTTAFAPLISEFYKEPKLSELIIIVGLTFIIQPFGQQFMVIWQKEMRFSEISKISVYSQIVTFVISILFAYKGFGVYALAFGTIAGTILQTVLFMILGFREYKPLFVFRLGEIREFLSFGLYQMGEKTINYINSETDVLLIGKLLGAESLGIYTIAKQLIMRPAKILNPIITKVTFPTMAKVQNDIKLLKNIYLKTLNYLSSINFPIYALIIVFAPEIVSLLFGYKWMKAVPIIRILSLYAALRSTGNPIGSILLAKGKANWGFWWNLGLLFYLPISIYISSHWGLVGIAWGLTFVMISLIIPNWFILVRKLCSANFVEYYKEIFIPFTIALITGIISYVAVIIVDQIILRIILGVITGLFVMTLLNFVLNRKFLMELKHFIKK